MITGRYNRYPCSQELDRDFSRYSSTAGCVLAVNDDEIQCILFFQLRHPSNDGFAPWFTYDIAQKKNR
jgi:hypothetical protein